MDFIRTNGENEDFILLCHYLDDYLNEIAGGEENRSQYVPYNKVDANNYSIVVYDKNEAIGCGSFKIRGSGIAEVKRVFLKKAYRGRGISKQIMNQLEQFAKEKSIKKLILETGIVLKEATGLYNKMGYTIIDNFSPYEDMPESVCMQKVLS
jgi:GNAT superfamily N-acetyltransferase